ncbi:MAG: cytochrome c maturation protein CcmE [Gemmatimonadetes bacterium]|nr:cytochrome c maturation protein CcmE [Gemmatimonadota bacterium]
MSSDSGRRTAVFVIAGVIVAGAFAYLMLGGIEDNLEYFKTPAELTQLGPEAYGKTVRLGGQVAPGSVKWDADALDLRFRVTDGAQEIEVHSKGAPPQMFRDGMGVVVIGRYGAGKVFESKELMIRHSEEYRAPKPGERPQEMYRSLIKGEKAS